MPCRSRRRWRAHPPDDCGDTSKHGLQLTESLDTVVGHTDTLLLRHHVLEDTLNNFIADAIRTVTNDVVASSGANGWTGVDISMANGFRFGNAVLPDHDITLRDLYTWFPIAPAVNVGDFSGQSIQKSLDTVLGPCSTAIPSCSAAAGTSACPA